MKSLLVLILFLCFNFGYGLRCYSCESSKSWTDCSRVGQLVICNPGNDRCIKATRTENSDGKSTALYKKGCHTAEWCRLGYTFSFCKGKRRCEVDCCNDNLCNMAAIPVASSAILVWCAFAVIMTVFIQ